MSDVTAAAPLTKGRSDNLLYLGDYLRKHPLVLIGYVIVAVSLVMIFVGPLVAPYPAEEANPTERLQPPSRDHWFGTDDSGMDIFSRVLHAPRVDLVIGLLATGLSVALGAPLGVLVGYYAGRGGWKGAVSEFVMRVADVVQAFPLFVLAIAVVSVTGQSVLNLILVMGVLYVPIYVRLTRSQALSVKERTFVEAAYSMGSSDRRIVLRHVMPNSMAPALAQMSVNVAWAILLAASLSFVGAGVKIPTAEWGLMIAMGSVNLITGEWWPALIPGAALTVTVLGYALVGESLQYVFNPAER